MDRPFRQPTDWEKKAHFELFNQEGYHKYLGLLYRLEELERMVQQLTTAPTTHLAPIKVPVWDAPENSTIPTTQPSSQSDQANTKSGPAEQSSECAHWWESVRLAMSKMRPSLKLEWCYECGALRYNDKILAQGVDQTSLTSVKQPSKEYVENLVEESVKSVLKELIEGFKGLRNFEGKTDKDKGYLEGILTAETCIEAKLLRMRNN